MSFITDLFSPPKPQVIKLPPPQVIERQIPVDPPPEARDEERRRRLPGRRATILTSPLGATDEPAVTRPKLLGQVK